jgi:predicted transport protein
MRTEKEETSTMSKGYTPHERFSLKHHPEFTEKWVQDLVANDPSVLGLGDLIMRDRERIQPRAGRLDLLLQDPETKRRYEVELQLGETDEAHIIRTIEYWDIERKRYPQYDHCAVLIAEDITSRFLNVVSLFNGTIPLIAIQMQALTVADNITLVFTTVMDELSRGYIDEDEDAESAPTDRAYWEKRGSKATVALADQLLAIVKGLDPSLELKYNKFYIGLSKKDGQPYNFVTFRPKKNQLNFELKLPQSDYLDDKIEEAGLETLEYSKRWGLYRLRLTPEDIKTKSEVLKKLIEAAYERRSSL